MPSVPSSSLGNQPSAALSEDNDSYQLCLSCIERMQKKKNQLLKQISEFQEQDHVIYLLTEQLCIQDIQNAHLQAHALHELAELVACLRTLLH
ncbi:hypothetical protein O181_128184 [Austropuccinia psidii MF-1]|uniref:Uncharacterized protein n=1 Tax=Austropuccinia psidii MF-1 TaxID=1389203 RepID=A0A9Q3Q7V9_9BASI|nr:hypothetical protein [Austropuccinia psidii MF-1]